MATVEGINQGAIISASIAIFGRWLLKGAQSTEKVVNAYKAKISLEVKFLLSIEELLAKLGLSIENMRSEETNYAVLQELEGHSASAAQLNLLKGQKTGGQIAIGLGILVATYYLSQPFIK